MTSHYFSLKSKINRSKNNETRFPDETSSLFYRRSTKRQRSVLLSQQPLFCITLGKDYVDIINQKKGNRKNYVTNNLCLENCAIQNIVSKNYTVGKNSQTSKNTLSIIRTFLYWFLLNKEFLNSCHFHSYFFCFVIAF